MEKFVSLALLSVLSVAGFAHADATGVSQLMGNGASAGLASKIDEIYGTSVRASSLPKTDNSIDLGSASKQWRTGYFGTSVVFGSAAQPLFPAAPVITPSTVVPTPAAGNTLSERRTIVAAGAPTAAFVVLPVATASVGKTFTVLNQGSNPVAIVPQTGVINVSAALTPFSCTTLKECQCSGLTTAAFSCSQQ